ncbi:MAG: hypothetical protein K6E13_00605, partial [Lachnospiraceae bacterium]|nr:hypothetical protein [Lachnospiraceae bacterium]
AAEDDTNAYNGMQEVMAMFDEDGVSYSYSQWDGTWSSDELSTATEELFTGESNAYFISWATGTIEADTESSAGNFGGSAPSDNSVELTENDSMSTEDKPQMEALEGSEMPENFGGPSDSESEMSEGEMSTSMNSSAYHMASFDYAYSCIAVMEWLFEQTK